MVFVLKKKIGGISGICVTFKKIRRVITLLIKKDLNMKKDTISKIANFLITVLTAALSTFFMQSCMGA